jgi:hypothetical protein
MAARIPMMATVMMSSVMVKPLLFFSLIFPFRFPIDHTLKGKGGCVPFSMDGGVRN